MAVEWVPDDPRVFNLGLRSRAVDHVAKTVTLELASDEALLMDYATLVEDKGARAHETSIRGVVNYVLGKIGASLAAGGPDKDVTAYWPVQNLLPNPSIEVDTAGWAPGFGATAPTRVAVTGAPGGAWGLRWTANAATSAMVAAPTPTTFRVTPGDWYVFTAYAYGSPRSARVGIQWFASDGVVVVKQSMGAAQTLNSAAVFKRLSVIAQAPAGASHANPFVYITGTVSGSDAFILDAAMFYEGDELIPYFDGATPDTAQYVYDWSGDTPHGSPSSRTPTTERTPELFIWIPGRTAWDFLAPITSSVSLRLFCDELRVWRLVDPADYEVAGYAPVTASNATRGVDIIGRDDPEVFATGVVVNYEWADTTGTIHRATDAAGTPEKVVVIDYPRPYPGPGAAAAILARRDGTGRVQDVSGLARWSATPGMVASIALPGVAEQIGKIVDVSFELDDTALMTLGTRDLIDLVPGVIDLLPGTIDALVGMIDTL